MGSEISKEVKTVLDKVSKTIKDGIEHGSNNGISNNEVSFNTQYLTNLSQRNVIYQVNSYESAIHINSFPRYCQLIMSPQVTCNNLWDLTQLNIF